MAKMLNITPTSTRMILAAAAVGLVVSAPFAVPAKADGGRGVRIGIGAVGLGIVGGLLLNEMARASVNAGRAERSERPRSSERQQQRARSGQEQRQTKKAAQPTKPAAVPVPVETAAVPDPARIPVSLPAADIEPLRQALEQMGYGSNLEKEASGPRLQAATRLFQQDIGAPMTGALTPDQLQVLYVRHASMRAAIASQKAPAP